MSLIIPDQVLEKMKCSFCHKYLSCGPTKIIRDTATTDTKVACGRCSLKYVGAPSLCNTIAKLASFPCVNRYEGCYKLLRYDEVKKHEEQCTGKKFQNILCPFCQSFILNSFLSLIDHCNRNHAQYVLKNPKICLTIGTSYYLYRDDVNNCLFLIYVKWDKEFILCNVSVAGNVAKQIMQVVKGTNYKDYCTDFNDNRKLFQISRKELQQEGNIVFLEYVFKTLQNAGPGLNYEPLNEQIYNWPEMFAAEEFIKKYGSIKLNELELKHNSLMSNNFAISIQCSYCNRKFWDCNWDEQTQTNPYIHTCLNSCNVCQLCFNSNVLKKCSEHNKDLVQNKQRPIYDIFFYCRNKCGLYFKFKQLREHEHTCFGISNENYYVKRLFGRLFPLYKDNSTYYIKGNTVHYKNFKQNSFNTATIYMITDDGLKCTLKISNNYNNYLKFEGAYDYDKSKYYLLFRICEVNGFREEITNCSIIYQDYKKKLTQWSFAVIFKEITNKTKLVIKTV